MRLVPSKTNLLLFTPKNFEPELLDFWKGLAPIKMDGKSLGFSQHAEHVGVLRDVSGSNLPAITSRISSHLKSIFHLLSCGGARSHGGNPAAAIAIENLYSAPSLYSGPATLVLSSAEMDVLSKHQKRTLEQLQRLHPRTPSMAVHFLSGVLPSTAQLHIKQFSLLGMIARLGSENVLYQQALHSLRHDIKSSWFINRRKVSVMYDLPDPIMILNETPS